jgi:cytochrome c553
MCFNYSFLFLYPTTAATPSLLASPPKHTNAKLEEIINKNKNESKINLNSKQLTDDDMAIVAYYLLKNNKVSN